MADLNEAEIRQITSSYQKVEQAYQSLRARFSKKNDWGSFQSNLGEAQSALRTYTTAEKQALKNADKIFEDAMSGKGGFFQNDGFLTSTNQIGEKAAKEIKGIINDYYSAANDIIKSIPSIGNFNSHYKPYTPSEYSGDKDYSSMKESDSSNNSNDSGVVVAAVAPSISNHSDYPDNDDVREMESPTPENFDVEVNAGKSANTKVSGIFETDRQAAVLGIGAISKLNARKILCTNVTEIQANAFKNLDKTEVIVLSDKIRQINVNAFRCVANSCIIAFINDRSTVESTLPSLECINNRKVIFGYQANDEYNPEKVVTFSSSKQETESKPKRVIIKANTPLNNNEIKLVFMERNAKYGITLDELNQGIENAKTDTNKDLILLETLKIKRTRDLAENSFWNYAQTLEKIVKLSAALNLRDEELNAIFGLFFLDSSGYRMVNGKYNPYKSEASQMYYHPKMEMRDLTSYLESEPLSEENLSEKYRNSPYVKELDATIKDAYYTIENSIQLMLKAMKTPDYIFYPAQSGIIRKH